MVLRISDCQHPGSVLDVGHYLVPVAASCKLGICGSLAAVSGVPSVTLEPQAEGVVRLPRGDNALLAIAGFGVCHQVADVVDHDTARYQAKGFHVAASGGLAQRWGIGDNHNP